MKRVFWMEALKGGTIIGLVGVGFSILTTTVGDESLGLLKVVNFLSSFVSILLAFGLTRKFAAQHSRAEGFSFGRGVGYVVLMMLFAGFIQGFYSAVMAKFFIGGELLQEIDNLMAAMQDTLPADQFDLTYSAMRSAVTNPLIITLSSMFSNVLYGAFMGIIIAFFTRRKADIFAEEENTQQ